MLTVEMALMLESREDMAAAKTAAAQCLTNPREGSHDEIGQNLFCFQFTGEHGGCFGIRELL
jgi:hypothetical protein